MTTRAPRPKKEAPIEEVLQAAAFPLDSKGSDTSLYSKTVTDWMINSTGANSHYDLAWFYWNRIPELHYITRYISNALSLACLYVGKVSPDCSDPERVGPRHFSTPIMANWAGGRPGQAELLDRLALHLTVSGDSILIGPREGASLPAPLDQWRIYSTNEVSSKNGQVYLKVPGNRSEIPLPPGALPIRIWRPHPQRWWEADSPVRSSFTVLRELDLLDQHVHASAVSRLSGAGMLLIPEELDLPTDEVESEATDVDQFLRMLTTIMSTAIKNRESAAALVPVMLRGPAEYLQHLRHVEFSTPFDERVPELRLGALRRLALGMDIPPEILLGQGTSTSWSAWQTDESTLRIHLTPLLQLIASSLTVGWLRPTLESLPLTESQRAEIPNLVIGYDLSRLQIHQDLSGDAQALYDRFEIDAEALRRSTGYSANADPTNEELARQILLHLVRNDPGLAPYAINALRDEFGIVKLPEAPEIIQPQEGRPPEGEPPATTEPSSPVPGERSQDKQTSPPPPPPPDGDPNNNEVGP